MPKISVLLGRRTTQVQDIDKPVIRIGRDEEMDVIIDNPSVSRRQVEIRREGDGWLVEDLGSSNGTYLGDERITSPRPIAAGDALGVGKFSIIFDRVVGDGAPAPGARSVGTDFGGTTHIKAHEVRDLLRESQRKRRAHLLWESGGQRGTHYLSESASGLFGTDDLCDVRVPKAPSHHILFTSDAGGCQIRNLARWTRMKVGGRTTRKADLNDGDVVEAGGLKLTFVAEIT